MSVVYQFKGIRGREVTRRTLAHAQRKEKERGGGAKVATRPSREGGGLVLLSEGGKRRRRADNHTHTQRRSRVRRVLRGDVGAYIKDPRPNTFIVEHFHHHHHHHSSVTHSHIHFRLFDVQPPQNTSQSANKQNNNGRESSLLSCFVLLRHLPLSRLRHHSPPIPQSHPSFHSLPF